MKNLILKSLVLLGLSLTAQARGGHVGNGGDAVVCYLNGSKQVITSIQMFDYWEQSQVVAPYTPADLGSSDLSVQKKIEIATQRIAKFDPNLAAVIQKNALNLANNINEYLVTSNDLPEIDDATPQAIPTQPNCFVEQFAVQYKDVSTGKRRFAISAKHYNHAVTTNDERAGLLLHEAIYRYAIVASDVDHSDGVRFFNYVAATSKISTLADIESYLNLLRHAGLDHSQCVNVAGLYYWKKLNSYSNDGLSCFNQTVKLPGNRLLDLTPKTEVSTTDGTYHNFKEANDQTMTLRIPEQGKVHTYKIESVLYDSRSSNVGPYMWLDGIEEVNGAKPLGINAPPENKFYRCNKRMHIRLPENEVQRCGTTDVSFDYQGQVYKFDEISKLTQEFGPGGWWGVYYSGYYEQTGIHSNTYPILGSKKGLAFRTDNYKCKVVVVNQTLTATQGSADECEKEMGPIMIGGLPEYVQGDFKVRLQGSKYVLTFESKPLYLETPRVQGLRLIDSSNQEDEISAAFCKKWNKTKGSHTIASEYITAKSERFYDLATQKVILKSDEDVDVIQSFYCKGQVLSTDDY